MFAAPPPPPPPAGDTMISSSVPVDNSARFELGGPRVCEGSLLKDGRSDRTSSDTDSVDGGLANDAPDPDVRPPLDLENEDWSKAYASDDVDDELDGRR
jgi:hypothetical protein